LGSFIQLDSGKKWHCGRWASSSGEYRELSAGATPNTLEKSTMQHTPDKLHAESELKDSKCIVGKLIVASVSRESNAVISGLSYIIDDDDNNDTVTCCTM
jgi:hypothetical protein